MKTERLLLWGNPKPTLAKEILKEILKNIEETKGGAE
jgi:hypothetical protein